MLKLTSNSTATVRDIHTAMDAAVKAGKSTHAWHFAKLLPAADMGLLDVQDAQAAMFKIFMTIKG